MSAFRVTPVASSLLAVLVATVAACGSSSDATHPPVGGDSGPDANMVGADGGADTGTTPPPDGGDAGSTVATGDPPACTGPTTGDPAPSPRGDLAGALDPAGKRLVVFGGDSAVAACNGIPGHVYEADTYVLDVGCGVWKKTAQAPNPGARSRHAMVTDADRGRALLFGGRMNQSGGAYTVYNDVWAFDWTALTWSQLTTSGTAPTGRANTSIALDTKGKQLVVFGGNTSTSGLSFSPQNDTFALDLTTGAWKTLAAAATTKPPARLFHAMAIDADARVAYVFGGGDANAFQGPFFKDVWALDLATETWTEVQTSGDAPLGRINHHVMYDAVSKRLVLFGGHDDGQLGNTNEVHVLDVTAKPAVWKKLAHGDAFNKPATATCQFPPDFTTIDKASPERRSAFAAGTRGDGRGFVVYAGKSDCGLLADAWWWSDASEKWTTMKPSPIGQSCLRTQTTCAGLCG